MIRRAPRIEGCGEPFVDPGDLRFRRDVPVVVPMPLGPQPFVDELPLPQRGAVGETVGLRELVVPRVVHPFRHGLLGHTRTAMDVGHRDQLQHDRAYAHAAESQVLGHGLGGGDGIGRGILALDQSPTAPSRDGETPVGQQCFLNVPRYVLDQERHNIVTLHELLLSSAVNSTPSG